MDNQIKQTMNQSILGNQSENPYPDLINGQQQQQQQYQQQQGNPQQQVNQQAVNHQAAFEEQMRQQQQNPQPQMPEGTYAFEQTGTYCRTGTLENGFIESDLQIYKEKGVETRFVSFSILSMMDEKQLQEVKNRNGMAYLTMMMTSEEQFNRFKEFVASLNWND